MRPQVHLLHFIIYSHLLNSDVRRRILKTNKLFSKLVCIQWVALCDTRGQIWMYMRIAMKSKKQGNSQSKMMNGNTWGKKNMRRNLDEKWNMKDRSGFYSQLWCMSLHCVLTFPFTLFIAWHFHLQGTPQQPETRNKALSFVLRTDRWGIWSWERTRKFQRGLFKHQIRSGG